MTPIERAARALGDIRFEDEVGTPPLRSILSDRELTAAVRAVIAAIREPSAAMIDDAYESYNANGGSLRDVFMDMIDKMLEEG
jgi:hypothetical protein